MWAETSGGVKTTSDVTVVLDSKGEMALIEDAGWVELLPEDCALSDIQILPTVSL